MADYLAHIRKLFHTSDAEEAEGHSSEAPRFDLTEVPKYPPYNPGLPAVTPEQIVESQKELVDRLRNAVPVSDSDFECTYLAAIRCYAAFVHLLPASESHHHRGTGGLFRHGLEAALYGAMHADRLMFVMDEPPSRRRVLEPIWRFAAFLAALNHDIGKPLSDVAIQDHTGSSTWNPFIGSLHQWAKDNRIDYYHIRFRPGRHHDHEMVGMLALEQVISPAIKQYLIEAGPKLMQWMIAAIANARETESINPFRDLVIRADRDSVERDLRINGALQSNLPLIGIAAERFVLDAMRRLVRNKTWKVNQKGARVWIIDGNLYIAWNAARDIVRVITRDNTPGVPRDPDSIADMLIERDLAVHRNSFHGPRRYWNIAPDVLDGVILKSLRLSSPDLLLDPPPGSVAGEVLVDEEEPSPAGAVNSSHPEGESPDHGQEPTNEASVAEKKMPIHEDHSDQDTKPEKPLTKKNPPTPKSAAPPSHDDPFKDNSLIAEVISTLVDDIHEGKRPLEAVRKEAGMVVMAWPKAFEGFGMEPRAVLTEMADAGLVESDPAMPIRMVRDDTKGNKIVALKHHAGLALFELTEKKRSEQPAPGSDGNKAKLSCKETTGNNQQRATKATEVVSVPDHGKNSGDSVDRFVAYFLEPGVSPPFPIIQIDSGISLPFNLATAYFARMNKTKPKVIKNLLLAEDEQANSRISLTRVRNSLRIEIRPAKTEVQTG